LADQFGATQQNCRVLARQFVANFRGISSPVWTRINFAPTKRQAVRNKFVSAFGDSPAAAQEQNDEADAETNAGIAAAQRTEINAAM
jgi:hypothetical protein